MAIESLEVKAVHDERVMADGRPAFAWWNEIQMLRAEKRRDSEQVEFNKRLGRILRVVEFKTWNDIEGDIHMVLTRHSLLHPDATMFPEKYLELHNPQ